MANRNLIPSRMPGLPVFGRDPFSSFRREMDRLFDDFFAPAETRSFASPALAQAAIMPSVDVHETEQAYTVTAELPGIDLKDIELNLSDNALTLSGEKRSERKEEDGGRRYSERSFGRFERIIPFTAEIDADRVEASCENGVLKVMLPKSAEAHEKTRRIEIRGAAGGQAIGSGKTTGTGQATGTSQTTGSGQAAAPGSSPASPG